nr:3'-5' exonuclease [Buchnera aphidicola]
MVIFRKNKNITITLRNNISRNIRPQDIAILVKNKYEAKYIIQALKKLDIPAIYTSHIEDVFKCLETKEIIWILDSILHPLDKKKFQKILITRILNKNINEIYEINKKKEKYNNLMKQIIKYLNIWNKYGLFNVIEKIIIDFNISKKNNSNLENNINIRIFYY